VPPAQNFPPDLNIFWGAPERGSKTPPTSSKT
jgi:hypothetical protein